MCSAPAATASDAQPLGDSQEDGAQPGNPYRLDHRGRRAEVRAAHVGASEHDIQSAVPLLFVSLAAFVWYVSAIHRGNFDERKPTTSTLAGLGSLRVRR